MFETQTQAETLGTTAKQGRSAGDLLIILLLLCVMFALVVLILPTALVTLALGKLLILASLAAAITALLCRDRLLDGRLTHWDQSAVLLGLGLLAALFTDVSAANAVFDTLAIAGLSEAQTASTTQTLSATPYR